MRLAKLPMLLVVSSPVVVDELTKVVADVLTTRAGFGRSARLWRAGGPICLDICAYAPPGPLTSHAALVYFVNRLS